MKLLIPLVVVLFLFSCKKEEVELPLIPEPEEEPAYEFIDQDLQGEFEGEAWKFISGSAFYAHVGVALDSSEFAYRTTLLYEMDHGNCTSYTPTKKHLICYIPLEEGLYELERDFGEEKLQQVLFSNITKNGAEANLGAINVIKVDTLKKELIFQLDARYVDSYFVNGNCTIPICN